MSSEGKQPSAVPLNLFYTYEELFANMPRENNQVWDAFVRKYRPRVLDKLGQHASEEEVANELEELLVDVDHPEHTYLHVFRCTSCPKVHRVEMPCMIISLDRDNGHNADNHVQLRNVTLAFSVPTADNTKKEPDYMFTLARNIEVLYVLGNNKESGLILCDPSMLEYAVNDKADFVH